MLRSRTRQGPQRTAPSPSSTLVGPEPASSPFSSLLLRTLGFLSESPPFRIELWFSSADQQAIRFIPRENGPHSIEVRLNGSHIPGSPFKIRVGELGQDGDPGLVSAFGSGLERGTTGIFPNQAQQSLLLSLNSGWKLELHFSGGVSSVRPGLRLHGQHL